jgi:hypothetical protein
VRAFFIFSPIRFTSAQLASSPPFSLPSVASSLIYVIALCRTSFQWSPGELAVSASSSSNASSRRLPSQAEIKVLNLHHCHRPPCSNHLTPTLCCYKKVIPTSTTLFITQSCLYFVFFLAKAPRHRSSTRRYRSLSPSIHVHRLCAQ